MDLKKISTESRNPNTMDIDVVSTKEILVKINNEDKLVAYVIEEKLDQIAIVVDQIVEAFHKGGRLIYMGAGTSGRLGVLDAVECPPTYGTPKEMVIGLMAGGIDALEFAVEGAEDSVELAIEDLTRVKVNENDIVIGIAASGRTPYVVGGIKFAKEKGAVTSCITTSLNSILASTVDYPIEVVTGAEAITGSTRMKSGTAQKLVCNMLTTASMIRMGKVYENLMIDMQPTNEKLVARAEKMVMEITGVSNEEAKAYIKKYGNVKRSIFAFLTGIENIDEINEYLDQAKGNIRLALKLAKGE
jgi:N-acetylmuramic acid 6-phosphate etherase